MKELPNYKKAVIVSGDGDFYCIVEYLAGKNKLAKLLAPNNHYSTLYRPYEEYVVVLEKLRKQLSYASFRKNPKKTK